MIGKPYSGKLNVRFDEGELEIGCQPLRQLSTLPLDNVPLVSNGFHLHFGFESGNSKEVESHKVRVGL